MSVLPSSRLVGVHPAGAMLDAYRHQDVPFDQIVSRVAPRRRSHAAPLAQVQFAVQNAPRAAPTLAGLGVEVLPPVDQRVGTDVEVHIWERGASSPPRGYTGATCSSGGASNRWPITTSVS